MSRTASGIKVEKAGLSFTGRTVFTDLSFELAGGSWTALLGPSGVGKSSLLRLIAGLSGKGSAVSGSVTDQNGAFLHGNVAYMAQRDLLLPWLTVLENVTIGTKLRGERPNDADKKHAKDLLQKVGLADRAQDLPGTLSGGMRQRVALARTLMEDRPIVLMDEPFSALDAITRFRLQETASDLLEGRTVFLVTHDPMEALRLADSILVLSGSPATLSGAGAMPKGERPRLPDAPGMAAHATDLTRRLVMGQMGAAS